MKDSEEANPRHRAIQDEISTAVSAIIDTKSRLSEAKTDRDKDFFRKRQASLEARIETIVSELYGLTVSDRQLIAMTVAGMG